MEHEMWPGLAKTDPTDALSLEDLEPHGRIEAVANWLRRSSRFSGRRLMKPSRRLSLYLGAAATTHLRSFKTIS